MKGLTPAQAAPLLGYAVSVVYEHSDGRGLPPQTRIPHLASVLGVPETKLRQLIASDRAKRSAPLPVKA